jgi:tetratricopeptide (TPR) repeat protein
MEDTSQQRAKEIFNDVLERPPGERSGFLQSACAGDAALRSQVNELLAAHVEAGEFLASPTQAVDPAVPATETVERTPLTESSGSVIGRYKLLQQIGEGGFGVVFMAEQREPVVRRVALKIIKVGMDTRQTLARFEAERQALAMMEHANIARVLDAGATQTGRPYFVMELVRGDPITEYADKHNLSTRDRLELFTQVCHAVQHAHQKGVIHRDIKPSNILVTIGDGRPIPKVIDFGIAKATSARLTEKTLFTEHRALIGTPAYMSPEQAEMSGVDIDTRSDIYSLGVLLYELLTGTTPFDAKMMLQAAYGEIQRIIREVEPPKPSTRLSAMKETLPTIAAHRHSEPGKLPSLIRGDLDWIVMKCLEKDRTRRYETANGVAMDVQRHLQGEPVVAAPASTAYRLLKFARRHRVGVLGGASVAAALLLGVLGTTAGLWRALQEREKAASERDRAVSAERVAAERAKEAEAITAFLSDMLSSADPARAGMGKSMRDLLAEACANLKTSFADQPRVEAHLRRVIGGTYRNLGLYEQAEQQLMPALDMHTRLLGETDPETIRSLNELAWLRLAQDRLDEAESLNNRTLATARRALGAEHEIVLQAMHIQAEIEGARGGDSYPLLEELVKIERRVLGDEHPDTLRVMYALALSDQYRWSWHELAARLEHVVETQRRVLGEEHPDTLRSTTWLGIFYTAPFRRLVEGTRLQERALEAQRRLLGEDHPDALESIHNLAHTYEWWGRTVDAINTHEKALAVRRRVLGEAHPLTLKDEGCLAAAYRRSGRTAESIPMLERVLANDRVARIWGGRNAHWYTVELGSAYLESGRAQDAVALVLPRLPEIHRTEWREDFKVNVWALELLADAYRSLGRGDDARRMAVEQLELLKSRAERSGSSAESLDAYALALLTIEPDDLRDPAKGLELAERTNELCRGEDPDALAALALACHQTGNTRRALDLLRQALELLPAEEQRLRKDCEERLTEFQAALEKNVNKNEFGDGP